MSKRKLEVIKLDDINFIDNHVSQVRNDDAFSVGTGMFFKSQLEHTFSTTLTATLPPTNAMRLFNLNTEPNEGATTYKQRMYEPTGEAIIISNFAADLPRVNVTKREESRNIRYIGDSYSYSIEDIMAARFAGEPLDTTLGVASREVIERTHNQLAWWGDTANNILGVLRHKYIPRYINSVPFNATSNADVIIAEINSILNSVNKITKTNSKPNVLVLPEDEYAYIMHTPRSSTSDTTIGEFLLSKYKDRNLRIEEAWELSPEYNNGDALCLAYKDSPLNQSYVAPLVFRQEPVQRKNLEFVVNCLAKSGGFYTPRPLEMCVAVLKR